MILLLLKHLPFCKYIIHLFILTLYFYFNRKFLDYGMDNDFFIPDDDNNNLNNNNENNNNDNNNLNNNDEN